MNPDTFLLHPADFATLVGVRRTRVGRWVWQGRTYRTRALALHRVPYVVHVVHLGRVLMDRDGVTKRGTMLGMQAPPLPTLYGMSAERFESSGS